MQLKIRLTTAFDISILCRKVSWLIPRILEGFYYPKRETDEASFVYLIPILFVIFPTHSVSQFPYRFTGIRFLRTKSVQFDPALVTLAFQQRTVPLRSITAFFKVSKIMPKSHLYHLLVEILDIFRGLRQASDNFGSTVHIVIVQVPFFLRLSETITPVIVQTCCHDTTMVTEMKHRRQTKSTSMCSSLLTTHHSTQI